MMHSLRREHHLPLAGKSVGLAAMQSGILVPAGCFEGDGSWHHLGHRVKKNKNLPQLALSFVSVSALVCNHSA